MEFHWSYCLFTARVRTYDGRLCFHRCVSVQLSGRGYPVPNLDRGVPHPRSGWGGTPGLAGGYLRSGWGVPQVWLGGTPSQVCLVGTPSQVWPRGITPSQVRGYPISCCVSQGTPHTWDGVSLLHRPGTGYPPHLNLGWGTPHTWDGAPPT